MYIGITTDLSTRLTYHSRATSDTLVARAVQKYGWQTVNQVIEWSGVCSRKELLAKEIEAIAKYRKITSLYNMTNGGDGSEGRPQSSDTKAKIGEASRRFHIQNALQPIENQKMRWSGKRRSEFSARNSGQNSTSAKLTVQDVLNIRKRIESYSPINLKSQDRQIAKEYGVTCRSIRNIRLRETWKLI